VPTQAGELYIGDDPSIVEGLNLGGNGDDISLSFSTDENGQLLSAAYYGEINQQYFFRYDGTGYSIQENFNPDSYRFTPGTVAFVNVAPVPLPATGPLLMFATAGLMWARRRKTR
jgi:hypothetical protein